MGQSTPTSVRKLECFEELNEAVCGAQREVVQLGRGRLHGYMAHLSIGDLPIDVGKFSVGMRSTGILNLDRITIGMLTGCTDSVTQYSHDVRPGDVFVTPSREEGDGEVLEAIGHRNDDLSRATGHTCRFGQASSVDLQDCRKG